MQLTTQNLIQNGWEQGDNKPRFGGYNHYEMKFDTDIEGMSYKLTLVDTNKNIFILYRENSVVIGNDNKSKLSPIFNGTLYSMEELETILDWTFYRDNKRVKKSELV